MERREGERGRGEGEKGGAKGSGDREKGKRKGTHKDTQIYRDIYIHVHT